MMKLYIPLGKYVSSNKHFTRVFIARDADYCSFFVGRAEKSESANMDLPEYFSKMGSGLGRVGSGMGLIIQKNDFHKYDC